MKKFAVIFDMDGTMVDNIPYHFKAWQALLKKYNMGDLSLHIYHTEISGMPTIDSIIRIFGTDNDLTRSSELAKEKRELYKELFGPYAVPINGLENLLSELKEGGVKLAMATSATVDDINFILSHVPVRDYFDVIIDGSRVSKPKPNPQIFLKAADDLGIPPENCIAFEDSLAGVKSANAAGMKVVAITTGHPADKLQPADMVITDFTGLTVAKLAELFED